MNGNMASDTVKDEFCAVCKSAANKKCSNCKIVYYCSREHQKDDWKTHSKNCHMYKLTEDFTFGRRYVATRQIETDEFVMRENKALVVVPSLETEPICLNCYVSLTVDNAKPCDKCGWPLCLNCTKHGPECELTMKYRKSKVTITTYSTSTMCYDSVIVMRVLALQQQNPDAYRKLMSLNDHCFEMMHNFMAVPLWSPNILARILKGFMKFDDVDELKIAKILGIVATHGTKDRTPKSINNIAVFDKPPYIEHNCHPNCRYVYYYDVNNGARMVVQAVTTIPIGHPIMISHTGTLQGTAQRRNALREMKFFECTCKRCTDPTEFGTMYSAVKCLSKKCNGFMLPPTFLVSKNEKVPDFICNKCNLTLPSTMINKITESISMEFSKIDINNVNQLEEFINNKKKILHENHSRILKAEYALVVTFYKNNSTWAGVSDELSKKYVTLCEKLIRQYEILGPHIYISRGTLQFLKYKFLMTCTFRRHFGNEIEFRRLSEECKKALTECYRLTRHEPKGDGANMAEFARTQLKGGVPIIAINTTVLTIK